MDDNRDQIEINPLDRYEQGIADSSGITIGLPEIPSNMDQLRYDLLPFKRRLLSRNGIRIFGMEYSAPIITQLRNTQISHTEKYIVKYDPRDIREVYLWAESLGQYYNIHLKDVYFSQLKINPEDPSNYPVSLKELELIKKNRVPFSQISLHEVNRSFGARQKMVEEAKLKTKTAKKARRIEEVRKVHKTKATSTQIRRDKKSTYIVAENENYDLIDDDDEIIAYPTEWEEVKKEMNLIYFDEEEEGEI